jgi:nonsense-mediated mRNA decay protein 3
VDFVNVDSEIMHSNIAINFNLEDKHIATAKIICKFRYEDLMLTEQHSSEIRIKYEQCKVCSKIAASYYDAIIQIRSDERPLSDDEVETCLDIVEDQMEKHQENDKSIFISKIEKLHGGFDFYISNQNVAKSIVKKLQNALGGTVTSSSSQAGQKDGKEIFKMTYLLRLAKYQKGDVVEMDGKIVLVENISSQKVELIELSSWWKFNTATKRIKKTKILAHKGDYRKGQIISQSDKELQLLDLENYKTFDVLKPEHFQKYSKGVMVDDKSAEIYFIYLNDELIIIPLKIQS